jgi:hypothetical protein
LELDKGLQGNGLQRSKTLLRRSECGLGPLRQLRKLLELMMKLPVFFVARILEPTSTLMFLPTLLFLRKLETFSIAKGV